MSYISATNERDFSSMLKKFNRKVQQEGILSESRRRAHFETPQAKRKRKAAAVRRKQRRNRPVI